MLQCWSGADRRVHHPQHRAGADAVRGGGRHVPDREDATDTAASHGADRGNQRHSCFSHRSDCVRHGQFLDTFVSVKNTLVHTIMV